MSKIDDLERLEREATGAPWHEDDDSWLEMNDISVWSAANGEGPDAEEIVANMGAPFSDCSDRDEAMLSMANARLIAATRNALPSLLACARALRVVTNAIPPCNCIDAYKLRDRIDPECVYHAIVGHDDGEDGFLSRARRAIADLEGE